MREPSLRRLERDLGLKGGGEGEGEDRKKLTLLIRSERGESFQLIDWEGEQGESLVGVDGTSGGTHDERRRRKGTGHVKADAL